MNTARSITPVLLLASLAVAFLLTAVSASAQRYEHHEAAGSGGLVYSTPLAGPGTDYAWDIAVDAQGNAYIAGMSDSDSLESIPTENTYRFGSGGGFDAVVVKLDQQGHVVYVAWIGGGALDQASRVAVGADGSAYIAGYTFSADFPVTAGAYDGTFNGGDIDAFVAKLSPDGSQLTYATFLGGGSDDFGGGLAVDGAGSAFVTGYTESADFPTTPGAYDPTYNGSSDVIAVRLNPAGSALAYASFIGSSGGEIGYDVAIGASGEVYLTGQANSPGFPTTPGVVGPAYGGGPGDAFVLKLSSTGGLAYSTYVGGDQFDDAKGVVVDAQG
ncbi:MAG TPA: SBBP repeat-containing protein, partial [Rubricoccaceae bacterium]|nr:SBBP repeat-containing protein [Rubricoccaceae bacterium]